MIDTSIGLSGWRSTSQVGSIGTITPRNRATARESPASKGPPSPPNPTAGPVKSATVQGYVTKVVNCFGAHAAGEAVQLKNMTAAWMAAHGDRLRDRCVVEQRGKYFFVTKLVDPDAAPMQTASPVECPAGLAVRHGPAASPEFSSVTAFIKQLKAAQREGAAEKLLAALPEDAERGVLLWSGVHADQFDSVSEHTHARFEFICTDAATKVGELWLYELPTGKHEEVSHHLSQMMVPLGLSVKGRGATTMNVGPHRFEPDHSFFPRHRATAGPYHDGAAEEFPTIVVEVPHSETDAHVRNKAMLWIDALTPAGAAPTTTIQECWVIRHSNPRGWQPGRMWFERFVRGGPNHPLEHIEFGTAVPTAGQFRLDPATGAAWVLCSAANPLPQTIPQGTVWHGVPAMHMPATAANWIFDLHELQQRLM